MSMHFAPQWVKPIKPSGTSLTPTAETPNNPKSTSSINTSSSVPFPALSNGSAGGTASHHSGTNPPLSYSRATHTPTTPGFPTDSSYFPYTEPNGHGAPNPHPFRYSREQILGLWDEDKVRERPIELIDMLDAHGVLVSKTVVKPVGLRELNEVEKKLLATSIHPPNPTRRQPGINTTIPSDPAIVNGPASRRTIGPPSAKDPTTPGGSRGTAFGGFGRGEGGAFGSVPKIGTIGGGVLSPGAVGNDGRIPGALGGGFGGVGRRGVRGRTESADTGPTTWRPSRTTSGSFEGVLGFGSVSGPPVPATPNTAPIATPNPNPTTNANPLPDANSAQSSAWKEKEVKEKEPETFGNGGGPGWGTGQKKWRLAVGTTAQESDKPQTIDIPISNAEHLSASAAASASGTPLPERDATVEDVPTPVGQEQFPVPAPAAPPVQEKEDLGAVEWFYRDPNGLEQGPFAGSQMHEWYSHAYFTDDLPLRRSSESSFHSLAELKAATGNAVQPFLSPVRPRLPPNLPIPLAALNTSSPINGVTDSLRNIGLGTQASSDPRISPLPQQPVAAYNQYVPERNILSPHHFPQNGYNPIQSPGGGYLPSPSQWGPPVPRFGPVGVPSPIGSNPLQYGIPQPPAAFSPAIGGPAAGRDFFSPTVGVGAIPPSPWGIPQPGPQAYAQQPSPIAPWHAEPQPQPQQAPQVIQEQSESAQQQAPPSPQPVDEPSYFPPQEEEPAINAIPEAVTESAVDYAELPALEEAVASIESDPTPEAPQVESEASPSPEPAVAKPPVSVWGQKKPSSIAGSAPTSRKSSIAASTGPTPLQSIATTTTIPSAKLPPAPASLPAKPSSAIAPTTEKPAPTPTTEKAASRPAPWADKDTGRTVSSGPSLREIQQAEAKEAEARKAARAAASPAPSVSAPGTDEIPQNLTWGLPTSQKNAATQPAPTPSTPVMAWGGGDAAPKKTLKQIQEEEEKRKAKAAQAVRAAQGIPGSPAAVAQPKRGYADLAAASQPPGAGWTTVGVKPTTPTATPVARLAAVPPKPATSVASIIAAKPATPTGVKPKTNGTIDDSTAPSVEFIRWTKTALTGLNVNLDEFIQMLLSFPIDPPAASRPEVLEIISDSVYANSSTLDGRRFAQEFFNKRKVDAQRPKSTVNGSTASVKPGSLADVVKSVPKKVEPDAGFRVVKAKGKKKN